MRTVKSYERLTRLMKAWAAHELDSLLVIGPGGTGKSHMYKELLGGRAYHLISARCTPIRVYCDLHDRPHDPVIFDDISGIVRSPEFLDFLKGLTCTSGKKVIRWKTNSPALEGRATSIQVTCPVLIILNRLPKQSEDLMAILDRVDSVEFRPTKNEVLRKMLEIHPEQSDLVELLSELPVMVSLRTLKKAIQWNNARELSLTEELFSECGIPEPVVKMVEIMKNLPPDQWQDEFMRQTNLGERSYRRYRRIAQATLGHASSDSSGKVDKAFADMHEQLAAVAAA